MKQSFKSKLEDQITVSTQTKNKKEKKLKTNKKSLRTVLQPAKALQVHSRSGQTEENVWSIGNTWYAFIHGQVTHAYTSCVCVQLGSPNTFSTRDKHRWQKAKILYNMIWSAHVSPLSIMRTVHWT